MLILSLLIPIFCSSLSSAPCPTYKCSANSSSTVGSTCVYNTSYAYTVIPCFNSSFYCDVSGPSQLGLCQLQNTTKSLSYSGEKCNNNTDCYSKICTGNLCVGISQGKACLSTLVCAVGLSCIGSLCLPLINIGNSGCSSDYDCVNNAGCSYINFQGLGTCIEYYSLAEYTILNTCYGNKNKLCSSGICGEYLGKALCLPELENSLNSPYLCSTTDYCYSENDTYTGIIINGKCECALDGNSYCTLFPGDPETVNYKTFRNAWINTKEIQLCHTLRRFSRVCMDQQ